MNDIDEFDILTDEELALIRRNLHESLFDAQRFEELVNSQVPVDFYFRAYAFHFFKKLRRRLGEITEALQ